MFYGRRIDMCVLDKMTSYTARPAPKTPELQWLGEGELKQNFPSNVFAYNTGVVPLRLRSNLAYNHYELRVDCEVWR